MKERPILFSGAMVRAILDGRKTQTRRIVKPQPPEGAARIKEIRASTDARDIGAYAAFDGASWQARCPYGAHGDTLWVKERLYASGFVSEGEPGIVYAADGASVLGRKPWPWKRDSLPSIHMPRWASRLTLAVESVRVERLHDLSEEDARAEGVDTSVVDPSPRGMATKPKQYGSARDCFADLWREINGAESWAANPWVWVMTFRREVPNE